MKVHSEQRTSAGHLISDRTNFEIVTDEKPSEDDIAEAQQRLGYHPAGYGGPWNIQSVQEEDGTWHTVWNCSGSSD